MLPKNLTDMCFQAEIAHYEFAEDSVGKGPRQFVENDDFPALLRHRMVLSRWLSEVTPKNRNGARRRRS